MQFLNPNSQTQSCVGAKDLNLPVVVHARDADNDTMHVLRTTLPREHKVPACRGYDRY